MAPKAGTEVADASFKFIFSVLKNCEEIKPDWEAVANENSIKYARNASARFKEILKKMGYAFENGKVAEINGASAAPKMPVTPKKAIKARTDATSSNKKRKLKDVKVEDDAENRDIKVKDEDGEGEVDAVEAEEIA